MPWPDQLKYLILVVECIPQGRSLLVALPFFAANEGLPAGVLPAYTPYSLERSCLLILSFSGCLRTLMISPCIARIFP